MQLLLWYAVVSFSIASLGVLGEMSVKKSCDVLCKDDVPGPSMSSKGSHSIMRSSASARWQSPWYYKCLDIYGHDCVSKWGHSCYCAFFTPFYGEYPEDSVYRCVRAGCLDDPARHGCTHTRCDHWVGGTIQSLSYTG